jgi:alcohol dehydrogenase
MAKIAVAMGVGHPWRTDRENAEKAITGVQDMNRRLKMPSGLAAMGVKESDIAALTEQAMEELVGRTNPRQVASPEQMRRLYLDSM